MDEHIDRVKVSIKAKLWNIAKDIGWSALSQIGEIVSFVKGDMKYEDMVATKNRVAMSKKDRETMRKQNSSESLLARKPSHSVLESLSSFSSVEDLNQMYANQATKEEKEMYVKDFVSMLREGLYVFAAYDATKGHNDGDGNKRSVRLRVLFYQDDDSRQMGVYDGLEKDPYFVLHPIEGDSHDEIEIIPLDDIVNIRRSGMNGIEFIASSDRVSASLHSSERKSVVASVGSGSSLAKTVSLISATSTPSISEEEEMKHVFDADADVDVDDGNGKSYALTEIVLSNIEDRETLFQGLKTCFQQVLPETNEVSEAGESVSHENRSTLSEDDDNALDAEDHHAPNPSAVTVVKRESEVETSGREDDANNAGPSVPGTNVLFLNVVNDANVRELEDKISDTEIDDAEMVEWNSYPVLTEDCLKELQDEKDASTNCLRKDEMSSVEFSSLMQSFDDDADRSINGENKVGV